MPVTSSSFLSLAISMGAPVAREPETIGAKDPPVYSPSNKFGIENSVPSLS